jgi:hypothetical protein
MKKNSGRKAHYHSRRTRAQTPPRVAARLEGRVKNRGTKPKKKPSKHHKDRKR